MSCSWNLHIWKCSCRNSNCNNSSGGHSCKRKSACHVHEKLVGGFRHLGIDLDYLWQVAEDMHEKSSNH